MARYIPEAFPSIRYHQDGRAVTVQTKAELAKLGSEWADSPAAWAQAPAKPSAKPKRKLRKKEADI